MNIIEHTPESVAERLRRSEHFGSCLIRESCTLDELELDSMDIVELLCLVHEEFGVRLTDDEFHPKQTVKGLFTQIAHRANAA